MASLLRPLYRASNRPSCRSITSRPSLLECEPRRVVLSGPSGFLGTHVLNSILDVHALRSAHGVEPGEVVLLSSSPGNLMRRLEKKYGRKKMETVRASRVDYFTQHSVDTWRDHLGSLGLVGPKAVFVNLAAVAGPVVGMHDAMMDINYKAPMAAAQACEQLGFGHWVQSSTQATNAERAGQVPYSRGKAMADFALSRMGQEGMGVTIACLGLLYSKEDGLIGQVRGGAATLNLIDLALLPLTPIMGDGSAPLQPQEVTDAAQRIAYLALTDPALRPVQQQQARQREVQGNTPQGKTLRFYDAVGPETMSILEMLQRFALYQGNDSFRPVFVDYRNMEMVLNVKSLGNLNRQFVSLLRSEQESKNPIIGSPQVWEKLLDAAGGPDAALGGGTEEAVLRAQRGSHLITLDEAFAQLTKDSSSHISRRRFPYLGTLRWALENPRVIPPGLALSVEIIHSLLLLRNGQCKVPPR